MSVVLFVPGTFSFKQLGEEVWQVVSNLVYISCVNCVPAFPSELPFSVVRSPLVLQF